MNKQREALQQALEALECALDGKSSRTMERKAIREIKEALAEPEQEPVAWVYQNANADKEYLVWKRGNGGRNWRPLYASPPRKPLTDEQVVEIALRFVCQCGDAYGILERHVEEFARTIERAHGIGTET